MVRVEVKDDEIVRLSKDMFLLIGMLEARFPYKKIRSDKNNSTVYQFFDRGALEEEG